MCDNIYYDKLFKKFMLLLLVIGGLVWGIIGVSKFNLVNWIAKKTITSIEPLIYILVGISALYYLFSRDFYLPFLGETVFPCEPLAEKIPDNADIRQIINIQPKIYNYIDKISRNSSLVYGFIAQQVREVIPEAVELNNDFIPNIFKLVDINNLNELIITNNENYNLKINDELFLITEDYNKIICKIIEINECFIKIDVNLNYSQIFIYGIKVYDFHVLDKSYIYTLNVCAIQDINKNLDNLNSNIEIIQESKINYLKKLLEK